MATSKANFTFRAKTVEAYTIKSLSEVLQNILTDVCFSFDKDGIKLLTVDNKKPPQLLVHLTMTSDTFDEFHCPKALSVGVNLQHLYKLLKSIKKKDSMTLFISKESPNILGITHVQADTGQAITSQLKIQKLNQVLSTVPNNYGHPIHIPTTTYQKLCKDFQGMAASKIAIYAKGTYMRFTCEMDGIYTREVPFGEIDETDEDEYEDTFFVKSLSQLIKVSGLNTRMQIYPPQDLDLPLKISINTGQLGKLEIFVKSIEQID